MPDLTATPELATDGGLPPRSCSASSEDITLREFQREMHSLNQWAQHGCGDGGCQIERPKGMHTNGGCRCNPHAFSEHLLWLACELEKLGRYRRWPKIATACPNDTDGEYFWKATYEGVKVRSKHGTSWAKSCFKGLAQILQESNLTEVPESKAEPKFSTTP